MWAIIFLIRLAKFAFQACLDLSTDTHAIPDLDGGHLIADLDGFTDDFMADTDWERAVSPTTIDGMNIGATYATALDLDVDVAIFERFGLEL